MVSHRRSRSARSSLFATLALSGSLVAAFGGFAPGCGSEDYRCDATGCYECDGYGCRRVEPPQTAPCAFAGDPVCQNGSVCTSAGCLDVCTDNTGCPQGTVCNGGFCTPPSEPVPTEKVCKVAADCPDGASCVDGKCVVPPACEGESCTCKLNPDCGSGKVCVNGGCYPACEDGTCPEGLECKAPGGFCAPPSSSQCGLEKPCDATKICANGQCRPKCGEDSDCKGADGKPDPNQRCLGGACVQDTRRDNYCTGDTQCIGGQQKCDQGTCRYTCGVADDCRRIFFQYTACSPQNFCQRDADVNPECRVKTECAAGKDCVDGACK